MKKLVFSISLFISIIWIAYAYERGDANGNGKIDIFDALNIAEYLAGLKTKDQLQGFADIDVNNNIKVDIFDALYVAERLAGLRNNNYELAGTTPVSTNRAPMASAGSAQTLVAGSTVILNGSASSDPDGDKMTYLWTQTSGNAVTLSSRTASQPSFTAPASAGTLGFSLVVNDGKLTSIASTVNITVLSGNTSPRLSATAGNTQVNLSWTAVNAATDSTGATLYTVYWASSTGVTANSNSIIAGSNTSYTHTRLASGTTYYYAVQATNAGGTSALSNEVFATPLGTVPVVPVLNRAPIVSISKGALVRSGANLRLSASSSSDPDGDPLRYSWTQMSGNLAIFSNNNLASTDVVLPQVAGEYRFQLDVSDGKGGGNTATASFTAFDVLDFKDQSSYPGIVPYSNKLDFEIETISSSNNFNIHWNQVKGARSYEFIFEVVEHLKNGTRTISPSNIGFSFGMNHLNFQYDKSVSGWSSSDNIYRSSYVRSGPIFTFQVKAYSGISQTGTLLDKSGSIQFKPGQSLPKSPAQVRVVSGHTSARLHWSGVHGAESYLVNYQSSGNTKSQQVHVLGANLFVDLDLKQGEVSGNIIAIGASGNSVPSSPFRAKALENVDLSIVAVTLYQSVQIDVSAGTNTSIPLIAGKPTLLRVFPLMSGNTQPRQAVVSLCGNLLGGNVMQRISKEAVIASCSIKSQSETSQPVLFELPSSWLVEGTSFHIELDLLNELEESNEGNNRFPKVGTQAFGFQAQPSLKIKLVPVKTIHGDTVISDNVVASIKSYISAMYPNDQIELTVHRTALDVSSGAFNWETTLSRLNSLRNNEVSTSTKDVFYYGLLQSLPLNSYDSFSGTTGLSYISELTNMSSASSTLSAIGESHEILRNSTLAHELGHLHGRRHVNNTDEYNDSWIQPFDTDANYPYNSRGREYGRIGHLGYDHDNRRFLSGELYHDIMSYCNNVWISDYTYKALANFQTTLRQHVHQLPISKPTLLASLTTGVWVSGIVKDGRWSISGLSYGESALLTSGSYLAKVIVGDHCLESFFDNTEVSGGSSSAFRFFIPSQERIKELTIFNSQAHGEKLFQQVSEPQVDLIHPTLFENLYHDAWTLASTFSDQRMVKCSTDGGATWTVICYDGDDQAFNLVVDQTVLIEIFRVKGLFIHKSSQTLEFLP